VPWGQLQQRAAFAAQRATSAPGVPPPPAGAPAFGRPVGDAGRLRAMSDSAHGAALPPKPPPPAPVQILRPHRPVEESGRAAWEAKQEAGRNEREQKAADLMQKPSFKPVCLYALE
jgi:hypothetical protein